jgi:biopolymer transport protein TolQ
MLANLGVVVQLAVLGSLLLASVVCWGIIVHKARVLRTARRQNARFLHAFRAANELPFMSAAARRFAHAPMARLFRIAYQQVEAAAERRRVTPEGDTLVISSAALEQVRRTLATRQAEEMEHLESGLPFLATTASVSPFVGLLGTVWGIMEAFHAIGRGTGASLAVVGPGISEALVATAAGLAAAIPAVVAYNYYLNRLRRLEGEIDIFVEELLAVFRSSVPSEAPRAGGRAPLQR